MSLFDAGRGRGRIASAGRSYVVARRFSQCVDYISFQGAKGKQGSYEVAGRAEYSCRKLADPETRRSQKIFGGIFQGRRTLETELFEGVCSLARFLYSQSKRLSPVALLLLPPPCHISFSLSSRLIALFFLALLSLSLSSTSVSPRCFSNNLALSILPS